MKGYAYAKGKPIYCVRSDWRTHEFGLPTNLQVFFSANKVFKSIETFLNEI